MWHTIIFAWKSLNFHFHPKVAHSIAHSSVVSLLPSETISLSLNWYQRCILWEPFWAWKCNHNFWHCALCVESELTNLQTTKANFIYYLRPCYDSKRGRFKQYKYEFAKKEGKIDIKLNLRTTKAKFIYNSLPCHDGKRGQNNKLTKEFAKKERGKI